MKRIFIPLAGVACLGLIIAVILLGGGDDRPGVAVSYAPSACDQQSAIAQALSAQGFSSDQYSIGSVDWAASEANERAQTSFRAQTPQSAQELVNWLNDGSAESAAVLNSVAAQSGVGRPSLLSVGNWFPVQFNIPTLLPGNTEYRNGDVSAAGVRNSDAGDIVWFFVAKQNCGSIVAVRAGCANPQTELPKPNPGPGPSPTPPTNPPTTPTTAPPCGDLCKGPDIDPAPCVDNNGVRCDGIPGSGGSPGNGGAVNHGDDGYSPSDPPPPPVVTTVPPPTSVVTLPPTSLPPTTPITPPPG